MPNPVTSPSSCVLRADGPLFLGNCRSFGVHWQGDCSAPSALRCPSSPWSLLTLLLSLKQPSCSWAPGRVPNMHFFLLASLPIMVQSVHRAPSAPFPDSEKSSASLACFCSPEVQIEAASLSPFEESPHFTPSCCSSDLLTEFQNLLFVT